MRVLLINPPAEAIIEPHYDRPKYPRTSLACLAAYLRVHDVDVHVLDCKYDGLELDAAMRRVVALAPDVVGFAALTNEICMAARFAARIKAEQPRVVTIIGDVHASALPERTLRETAPELRDALRDRNQRRSAGSSKL